MEGTVENIPAEIEDFYDKELFTKNVLFLEECPECGMNSVTRNGRCRTCTFCGYSSCDL